MSRRRRTGTTIWARSPHDDELKCIVNASASLPSAPRLYWSLSIITAAEFSIPMVITCHPPPSEGADEEIMGVRVDGCVISGWDLKRANRHNWDSAHEVAINLIVMRLIANKSPLDILGVEREQLRSDERRKGCDAPRV